MSNDAPTLRRLPVSWWTVAIFAVVLTAADGFWATSLRGAVGYIEDTQQPFPSWLRHLAVMLPIFAGAVVGALCLAHHWCRRRRGAVRLGVAALLVAVLATAIGIGQIALTATYDYRTQSNQLALMHRLHDDGTTAYRVDPGTDLPAASSGCSGLCSSKQQTLAIHLRAIAIATILLLVTNTMLVLWALALRGGRVWARRRGPAPVVATETEPGAAVAVA